MIVVVKHIFDNYLTEEVKQFIATCATVFEGVK